VIDHMVLYKHSTCCLNVYTPSQYFKILEPLSCLLVLLIQYQAILMVHLVAGLLYRQAMLIKKVENGYQERARILHSYTGL